MPDSDLPELAAEDLARRLEGGERLQVLDIRVPERVAQGRLALGAGLDFHAVPASELYGCPSPEALGLDPGAPLAVVCGHGNSSRGATRFLRERGFEAYSVRGGMAAWETVYLARRLAPTPALAHIVQVDRVAKGALSYILVSDGDAVVVDPGRHVERYGTLLAELGATPVAVVDTHMHADYLSGAAAAARRWGVPYLLHPEDARSPYDGTAARLAIEPLREGDAIAFGHTTLAVRHTPGHTLGSVTLVAGEAVALTGDFVFVQSVGRPDLGGDREAWARLLWRSLERARREWPGELLVLPAHYAGDTERRADRAVAARADVIAAINAAFALPDEHAFLAWIAAHSAPPPEAYRTIKLANLGLVELGEAEAEMAESGPNRCAVA